MGRKRGGEGREEERRKRGEEGKVGREGGRGVPFSTLAVSQLHI